MALSLSAGDKIALDEAFTRLLKEAGIPNGLPFLLSVVLDEAGDGGVTTMAAVGATPNANGASISSTTLTLQPASLTLPGVMTAATQVFGGQKSLANGILTNSIGSYGSSSISIFGAPVDGGSAIGTLLGSSTTLANAAALLVQIKNNTSVKASFGIDGVLNLPGVVSGSNFINALDGARLNFSTADVGAYLARTGSNVIGTPGTLSSTVASGSDAFAVGTSGGRVRIAPTGTDANAFLDYGVRKGVTGIFSSANFSTNNGDIAAVSNNGNVAVVVVDSNNLTQFSATSSGLCKGALGMSGTLGEFQRKVTLSSTAVGNTTTGEDVLIPYTLVGTVLRPVGSMVRIRAWGSTANNINAKTLKLYWGTAVILTTSLATSIASNWVVDATIINTGSNTQDVMAELRQIVAAGASVGDIEIGTAVQDDGNPNVIQLTGEATDTDDIVQEGLFIEWN